MLRKSLLIACLGLSTIALYSCKDSNKKSNPTTTQVADKKTTKLIVDFNT